MRKLRGTRRAWKASPTSSPPSCRGRSTRACEAEMSQSLQPGGALSNRRARRRSRLPMSEINVTPMVDVMLVLLIIFMVTAPLLTVGVDIDANATLPEVELPATEAGQVNPEQAPLSVTVD